MPGPGYPPNFSESELACNSGGRSALTLTAFGHLAWSLQQIRSAFGKPVRVNSGYRSPSYNKKIGGVKNSQHVQALAADLAPSSGDADDLKRLTAVVHELAPGKIPNGGIGTYSTFVHYDMRPTGPARWKG